MLLRCFTRINAIPKAEIKVNNSEMLSKTFLGHKLSYPIGLAPGIDNIGSSICSLNSLGFQFIEIGPVTNESNIEKRNHEIILQNNSLLFNNFENFYSIEDSLSKLQKEIRKYLKSGSNTNLVVSTNIKISNKSLRTVPYMTDTIFIKMI